MWWFCLICGAHEALNFNEQIFERKKGKPFANYTAFSYFFFTLIFVGRDSLSEWLSFKTRARSNRNKNTHKINPSATRKYWTLVFLNNEWILHISQLPETFVTMPLWIPENGHTNPHWFHTRFNQFFIPSDNRQKNSTSSLTTIQASKDSIRK